MIRLCILFLLLASSCNAGGWDITITATAPLPAGYSVEVISYEGESFEFVSWGEGDAEEIRICGTPDSSSPGISYKKLDIRIVLPQGTVEGILTKSFHVEIPNETQNYISSNPILPTFDSNFSR